DLAGHDHRAEGLTAALRLEVLADRAAQILVEVDDRVRLRGADTDGRTVRGDRLGDGGDGGVRAGGRLVVRALAVGLPFASVAAAGGRGHEQGEQGRGGRGPAAGCGACGGGAVCRVRHECVSPLLRWTISARGRLQAGGPPDDHRVTPTVTGSLTSVIP